MKMFRIDYEWYEYLGADMWDTHTRYRYVLGWARLGRECYKLANEDDTKITAVWSLCFSLRGLWVCWRGTDTQFKNRTQPGKRVE